MTDDLTPEQHEEVSRMLREQGSAQAPGGLSDTVMRQVRAEPRSRDRSAVRLVAVLAAAALLAVAAIAGISRLGSGTSSSAESAAGGATGEKSAAAPTPNFGVGGGAADQSVLKHVAEAPLRSFGIDLPNCPTSSYSIRVPAQAYDQVTRKLTRASRSSPTATTGTKVIIRRDPTARRITITCP